MFGSPGWSLANAFGVLDHRAKLIYNPS